MTCLINQKKKRMQCSQCLKKYKTQRGLAKHIRIKHPTKPYEHKVERLVLPRLPDVIHTLVLDYLYYVVWGCQCLIKKTWNHLQKT
uniref:C2H2-type domain-containing protein n=1 Tax=viral metagenome TaxID=1070528 RepID=A0A6C0BN57_9ZZZZ